LLRRCGKSRRRIQVNGLSVCLADRLAREAGTANGGGRPAADLTEIPALDVNIELDGYFRFLTRDNITLERRLHFALAGQQASLSQLVEEFVTRCSEFFPELAGTKVADFKVRAINDRPQRVRVVIELSDGLRTWKMGAVNSSIANATLNAAIEALEYRLCMDNLETVLPGTSDSSQSVLVNWS